MLVFCRASIQIRSVNSVDAEKLRKQAAHSRRLAGAIGDEHASRALIELAEEYEVMTAGIACRVRERPPCAAAPAEASSLI